MNLSHADLATQASTLGDRSHQKREMAALSIEMSVRQIINADISLNINADALSVATSRDDSKGNKKK